MTLKARVWHTVNLWFILNSFNRALYIKKHQIFHKIGDGCSIMERKIPLYSELISIGNNVHLASKVNLICHDAIHLCLSGRKDGHKYKENIGCIEIGDNVFIGANTTVLNNVRIGSNVIIGAGSLVARDLPGNGVYGGIPARWIKPFDEFSTKRRYAPSFPDEFEVHGRISPELEKWLWEKFYESRGL